MKKEKIIKINKSLTDLPDRFESQVSNFVAYLKFSYDIETESSLPDEKKAINEYLKNKKTGNIKLISWDELKKHI